jgi:hypothetical protein
MSKSNSKSNGKGGAAKASPSTASQGGAKVEKKVVTEVKPTPVKKVVDNSIEAKAKRIFAVNPNANELHFTSDNMPFFSQVDAKSHASSLENKEIKTINR